MMKHNKKWILASALLSLGGAVCAQTAGTWMVRAGAMTIAPQVTSGDLSSPSFVGTKTDISSASQVAGGITYMLTNNISLDVPLALPFTHDLIGDGAIKGVGKIGETKALPMTLTVQYRFMDANSKFRPYVGLGATYAKFFKEKGTATLSALTGGSPTNLSIESKWGVTPQAGATMAINDKWFVDGFVSKTMLKNRTTLSTGQTIDVTLDPLTYGLAVGYKF
jgi:outer membrane protein